MDIADFLFKKTQVVQKHLSDLLSPTIVEDQNEVSPFEEDTSLVGLDIIGWELPKEINLRLEVLFHRLTPYFEAGLLFRAINSKDKSSTEWSARSAFRRGKKINLSGLEKSLVFEFPRVAFGTVLKARGQDVLEDLGLQEYSTDEKVTTLAFALGDDRLIVLISKLADPWLKVQVEKVHSQINSIVADIDL